MGGSILKSNKFRVELNYVQIMGKYNNSPGDAATRVLVKVLDKMSHSQTDGTPGSRMKQFMCIAWSVSFFCQ